MFSNYSVGGYIGGPTNYPRSNLVYVGSQVASGLGTTANIVLNYNLTGGTNSTPQAGDFVIVAFAASVGSAGTTLSYRISGYTQIADLFSNDQEDTELQVGTKFMTSTPDTSVTITAGSGNAAHAYAIAVHVWRNVDTAVSIDVTATTAITINSLLVNPASITPVTTGTQIVVIGAGAHTGGVDTYSAGYLSNFRTTGADDGDDISIGIGSVLWTGGTYDPAPWVSSQVDSVAFSAAAVTLALRPSLRRSGVFNLNAVDNLLRN
jgi:hypothetical protein